MECPRIAGVCSMDTTAGSGGEKMSKGGGVETGDKLEVKDGTDLMDDEARCSEREGSGLEVVSDVFSGGVDRYERPVAASQSA